MAEIESNTLGETEIIRIRRIVQTLKDDDKKMRKTLSLPDEQFCIDKFLYTSTSLKGPRNRKPIVLDPALAETASAIELKILTRLVNKIVRLEEQITLTEAALVKRVLAFENPA